MFCICPVELLTPTLSILASLKKIKDKLKPQIQLKPDFVIMSTYLNNNFTSTSVCPSAVCRRQSLYVSENQLQFLQLYDKKSLKKVAWYVLVKWAQYTQIQAILHTQVIVIMAKLYKNKAKIVNFLSVTYFVTLVIFFETVSRLEG